MVTFLDDLTKLGLSVPIIDAIVTSTSALLKTSIIPRASTSSNPSPKGTKTFF